MGCRCTVLIDQGPYSSHCLPKQFVPQKSHDPVSVGVWFVVDFKKNEGNLFFALVGFPFWRCVFCRICEPACKPLPTPPGARSWALEWSQTTSNLVPLDTKVPLNSKPTACFLTSRVTHPTSRKAWNITFQPCHGTMQKASCASGAARRPSHGGPKPITPPPWAAQSSKKCGVEVKAW